VPSTSSDDEPTIYDAQEPRDDDDEWESDQFEFDESEGA
jgi:hypothetical protein